MWSKPLTQVKWSDDDANITARFLNKDDKVSTAVTREEYIAFWSEEFTKARLVYKKNNKISPNDKVVVITYFRTWYSLQKEK
jgi:prolyl oligopeptidase PreP (S9A serine peptidase family)